MRWLISMVLLLQGCADLGYYWHSASGHLAVMNQRESIEDLLADEGLESNLRDQLLLVQEMRQFSIERLALPDNDSYQSYVQLDRPYVLQNLFAAPEFSTRLYQWCYPIIGCASYRGYYDEARLQSYVEQLEADHLEVYVGQVPAYSTLGWFDDPILSSFINWPEYRLAGLLFHELTHQRIFIGDDTTFNESLATAVQQAGTRLWLESRQREDGLNRMQRWLAYRKQVITLIDQTRDQLDHIYRLKIVDADKRQRKQAIFDQAQVMHGIIAHSHGIEAGFTHWFESGLNNAKVGSVGAYNDRLEAFLAILEAQSSDFSAFFNYVDKLGRLEKKARNRCLDAWTQGSFPQLNDCPV